MVGECGRPGYRFQLLWNEFGAIMYCDCGNVGEYPQHGVPHAIGHRNPIADAASCLQVVAPSRRAVRAGFDIVEIVFRDEKWYGEFARNLRRDEAAEKP